MRSIYVTSTVPNIMDLVAPAVAELAEEPIVAVESSDSVNSSY